MVRGQRKIEPKLDLDVDPAEAIQQDVFMEEQRHRNNRRSGPGRHTGQKLGNMTLRKKKKNFGGLVKGSKKVVNAFVPGFLLSRISLPPVKLNLIEEDY